jgi:hypothetical protein
MPAEFPAGIFLFLCTHYARVYQEPCQSAESTGEDMFRQVGSSSCLVVYEVNKNGITFELYSEARPHFDSLRPHCLARPCSVLHSSFCTASSRRPCWRAARHLPAPAALKKTTDTNQAGQGKHGRRNPKHRFHPVCGLLAS